MSIAATMQVPSGRRESEHPTKDASPERAPQARVEGPICGECGRVPSERWATRSTSASVGLRSVQLGVPHPLRSKGWGFSHLICYVD